MTNYKRNDTSPRLRFLLFSMVAIVSGILYYSLTSSSVGGFIAIGITALLLLLSREWWNPKEYRVPRVVTYPSLTVFFSCYLGIVTRYEKASPLFESIYQRFLPWINKWLQPKLHFQMDTKSLDSVILFILLLFLFLLNYIFKRKTTFSLHPVNLEKSDSEESFILQVRSLCGALRADLRRIEKESEWEDRYFTPLDAEVEISDARGRKKTTGKLLSVLTRNRWSRCFLVLGDPGSGKSIALRKLAVSLLEEVRITGRIPVYINLREWTPLTEWSGGVPSITDLQQFVITSLRSRLDLAGQKFIDRHYENLHNQGRFFYILDSFDEIPLVLDALEGSLVINQLSDIILRFIQSGEGTRGILASRLFRKPRDFEAEAVLEIRPFPEYRIKDALLKAKVCNAATARKLLQERPDMISSLSNPFTTGLLVNYFKTHANQFPDNSNELFTSYIKVRVEQVQSSGVERGIPYNIVIEYSIKIATSIFSVKDNGLAIDRDYLRQEFQEAIINSVINILVAAKIGRLSIGDKKMFSFVHRRFNEYFVTQYFKQADSLTYLESVPTDSRYRDALVLYCEVAPEAEARRIATACWHFIQPYEGMELVLSNPDHLKIVHCLRFLRDAFSRKPELISSFSGKLSDFILMQVHSKNFIIKKIAIESSSLLDKQQREEAILLAFQTNNPYIQESSFRAGRNFEISNKLTKSLFLYLISMDASDFLRNRNELSFSFQLIPSLRKVYRYFIWVQIDYGIFLLGCLFLCCHYLTLGAILFSFWMNKVSLYSQEQEKSPTASWLRKQSERGNERMLAALQKYLEKIGIAAIIPEKIYYSKRSFMKWLVRFLISFLSFCVLEEINIHFPYWIGFCILVGTILTFPLLNLILILRASLSPWKLIRSGMLILVAFFLFMLVMDVITISLGNIGSIILAIATMISLLWLAIYAIVSLVRRARNDKKFLAEVELSYNMERSTIARQFNSIHFSKNRSRYVKLLEENVKHPSGLWPENVIPNRGNDTASLQLMKLEMKWLSVI